jgi:hypothetical protein
MKKVLAYHSILQLIDGSPSEALAANCAFTKAPSAE